MRREQGDRPNFESRAQDILVKFSNGDRSGRGAHYSLSWEWVRNLYWVVQKITMRAWPVARSNFDAPYVRENM